MGKTTLAALVFVTAPAFVACGGTDEGRPEGGPPESVEPLDPCRTAEGYEFHVLADFDPEAGGMPPSTRFQNCEAPYPCNVNYNYDQANTPPAPPPAECPDVPFFSEPPFMETFLAGHPVGERCGESEYATRVVARNLAVCTNEQGRQGWGGSLSLSFADNQDEAIDVTEWDGFSFWVKKASPATRSAFISAAADNYTAGYKNIEDPIGGNRSCDSSGATVDANGDPIPDTAKCDGFGVAVTMADDWTFIPVRFSAMRQKGFGLPSHLGHLAAEEFVRIQFLVSAGDWDVWIDDIAFFREPEP